MSWIFGIIGNYTKSAVEAVKSVYAQPLMVHQSADKYLACGGICDTCFFDNNVKMDRGWMVCGTGITTNFSLMQQDTWRTILAAPHTYTHTHNFDHNNLSGIRGGHYIVKMAGRKTNMF